VSEKKRKKKKTRKRKKEKEKDKVRRVNTRCLEAVSAPVPAALEKFNVIILRHYH